MNNIFSWNIRIASSVLPDKNEGSDSDMILSSECKILVDPDAARCLGLNKLEMACYLYDFLGKYCSDEEVIKYIGILQGEYDDDDFVSSMATKFEMLRKSNVLNKKYDEVVKCLEEKDCKSDTYTAINAYLEEWDDMQDRSTELNDPNRQAG